MLFLEPPSREIANRFWRGEADGSQDAPPIIARWARAAALGANAESDASPEITSDADLRARRDRLAEVFREEHSLLAPVTDELAATELVAVIADQDGVILESRGGGAFDDAAARVRLVAGARWSEDVRGTNAIGTALVEGRPVAVVGAAHFERRNHNIFCYADPIVDGYGDIVAVLDVTGPLERHDRAVGLAVRAAASSLQHGLRNVVWGRAGAGTLGTVERLVLRAASASMLVEASGEIRVLNDSARLLLGVRSTSLACESVFGVPASELCRLAVSGEQGIRFETLGTTFRVELSPLLSEGRPFAVVVHLERREAARGTTPLSVEGASGASGGPTAPPLPSSPLASSAPSGEALARHAPPLAHPFLRHGIHPAFQSIVGTDETLIAARAAASRFASTSLPVLVYGEEGTGKELFAHAIHQASARANGPFVVVHCGATPESSLERELFGGPPGSMMDGKIAAARGGTLFLDEITALSAELQGALLRVIDDPRGAASDLRLVCATTRELPPLVEAGSFRRDLFFRIHGAFVKVPSVRERSDRLGLADALLRSVARPGQVLATSAKQWILKHRWPGNVRELETALLHASALADDEITVEHFPQVLAELDDLPSARGTEPRTRTEIVNDAILEALRATDGNVSEAARRLGVARSTVYRVLRNRSRP